MFLRPRPLESGGSELPGLWANAVRAGLDPRDRRRVWVRSQWRVWQSRYGLWVLTGGPASDVREDRLAPVVLVVEDHELFATTLCLALHAEGFTAHRAALDTPAVILAQAATLSPGVVVLDLHLGRDRDGNWIDPADLTVQLRRLGWAVLIVTGSRDEESEAAAIAAGAIGSLLKSAAFPTLLATIRAVVAGKSVMTETERRDLLRRHNRLLERRRALTRRFERLSAREREVLDLLGAGYRGAEIAAHFVVSLTTVRTQIRSVLAKLEVNSQLEATALLQQHRTGPPR